MEKKGRKKFKRPHPQTPRQSKPTAVPDKSTTPTQPINAMPNKWNKLKNLLHITLSVSGLFAFVSDIWWIPMLIKTSFIGGYVLFLVSNGLLLGLVIYLSARWLSRKYHVAKFAKRIGVASASVAFLVFMVFVSLPLFSTYFGTSQGGIDMPTFVDASTPIFVHYGTRTNDYFYTNTTIGELKEEGGQAPLRINGQDIFVIHIEDNRLYIDTSLFAGFADESQHIFSPPVVIQGSMIINRPDGWETNQHKMNLEIVNQDGIPVLIMQYKNPYSITISGLFVSSFGVCKVDNDPGNIYRFGDTLSELGVYKVDRVFIHNFGDLFRPERT